MSTEPTSPLRYPGSKAALSRYLDALVHENLLSGCHLYEPYAGGASLSLSLLASNTISRATLVERDPLMYSFWKVITTQPDELARKIERITISVRRWTMTQKYLSKNALREFDSLELATAALFLNRTNFSGILHAKPIGGMSQSSDYPIDCRFNKTRILKSIASVAKISDKIDVHFGDAIKFLHRRSSTIAAEHALVYIDPPYLLQGPKLYRYHYSHEDHRTLAEFLNPAPFKWVVSYDNHTMIRQLFSGQKIVPIFLNYAVRASRKAEELLISNIPLLQPVYRDRRGNVFECPVDGNASASTSITANADATLAVGHGAG